MCFSLLATRADDLFEDIPPRQLEALSLRFGEGTPLTPYRQIGERLGISHPAAVKLVKKGAKRLRANGVFIACLTDSGPCP